MTAALVFGGAIFWLTLSIPIGIISALRPRSLIDRAGMVFVLIGLSAHPVWIGLIFAYFIGFKLELTPITGYADFFNPSQEHGGPSSGPTTCSCPGARSRSSSRRSTSA